MKKLFLICSIALVSQNSYGALQPTMIAHCAATTKPFDIKIFHSV